MFFWYMTPCNGTMLKKSVPFSLKAGATGSPLDTSENFA
jgi:hypothetical protein